MKKSAIKLFFVVVFVVGSSFPAKSQVIKVGGSIEKGIVKRGVLAKGSIILSIPRDLHVNSNKPTSEYMIPTVVRLSSNQVKSARVNYPEGKNLKFEFSDEPINVYEGQTSIEFTFNVPKMLKSKTITIRALVSYQACTNEVCYPPQKKVIFLAAAVK